MTKQRRTRKENVIVVGSSGGDVAADVDRGDGGIICGVVVGGGIIYDDVTVEGISSMVVGVVGGGHRGGSGRCCGSGDVFMIYQRLGTRRQRRQQ